MATRLGLFSINHIRACASPQQYVHPSSCSSLLELIGRQHVEQRPREFGTQPDFGRYGIKSVAEGRLSRRAIEAARRAIMGHFHRSMSGAFRKNGKVWVRVFAGITVTAKPVGVRMGRGKGNPIGFEAHVPNGQILFEMDGVSLANARQAAILAGHKLAVPTKFFQWS